jgi:hypothetical protein
MDLQFLEVEPGLERTKNFRPTVQIYLGVLESLKEFVLAENISKCLY